MNYEKQNIEAVMKKAKQVIAKIVKVACPHCGEEIDGWGSDPRGTKDKCDYCGKKYKIASDAKVVVRG